MQASYTGYQLTTPLLSHKPCKLLESVTRVCQRQLAFLVCFSLHVSRNGIISTSGPESVVLYSCNLHHSQRDSQQTSTSYKRTEILLISQHLLIFDHIFAAHVQEQQFLSFWLRK